MRLIDTHCHLYLEDFDDDREDLIIDAKRSDIEMLLMPNVDLTTVERMHKLCDKHPTFAFPMMGLHPTSVGKNYAQDLKATENFLGKREYCAIGEIGIDLYWDKSFLAEQIEVFEEQLNWSINMNLPVAIHTREAYPEVLNSIHKIGADKLRGVFHSFTGTAEELKEINKLENFKIGINGVVTFKNSKLSEIIKGCSIDKILLETDAPYLSPVPYRGRRNEPTYIWNTAKKVAESLGLTLEETVESCRKSSIKLFNNIKPLD